RFGDRGGAEVDGGVPQGSGPVVSGIAGKVDRHRPDQSGEPGGRIGCVLTCVIGEDRLGLQSHGSPIIGRGEGALQRRSTHPPLDESMLPVRAYIWLTSHCSPMSIEGPLEYDALEHVAMERALDRAEKRGITAEFLTAPDAP